jgi:hypothetical protein
MEQFFKELADRLNPVQPVALSIPGVSVPLAAVPDGFRVVPLQGHADAPQRIVGLTKLHRFDDFVDYVNLYKSPSARIFVAPNLRFTDGGTLAKAYLDFPAPGTPAWTTHEVDLCVACSLPYKLLTELDGKMQDQNAFALQLKDVAKFCSSLSVADLLELVQTLTLSSKGEYASVEDDFSGSVKMGYDVRVTAKSDATSRMNINVPTELSFELPVLHGGASMTIVAELLYRLPAGPGQKVQMGIRLPERKYVEREVLESTAEKISGAVQLPVALGETDVPDSPEFDDAV